MNQCLCCGSETKSKFCGSSCSAKFNNARRPPRSDESREKTAAALRGNTLSAETKEKISKSLTGRVVNWVVVSNETKKKISKSLTGRSLSQEHRDKLSLAAKRNGFGGHTSKVKLHFRKNDGTSVYLQSSYEIRFAEILESLDIQWSRPESFAWIDDSGADHKYYPDFKVGNVYIDTKNDYLVKKDARKIELVAQQNSIDLRVVTENQISEQYITSLI